MLKEAIDEAIKNRKWRVDYMTLEMKIREERAQAKEEGRKEGYEEIIKAMLIKGKTIEEISDICDLDLGLVKEIAKRCK